MTKEWHLSRYCMFCIAILLFTAGNRAWAATVSRDAQRHMNRGMAATEMANSPAEYEEAIGEFEQAVRLSPDWPAPYFNLGCVQKEAGKYQEALNNYRKYLELVPNAPDAESVQTEIDQVEYKLEKILEARQKEERIKEKYSAVLGVWSATEENYTWGTIEGICEVRLENEQLMVSAPAKYPKKGGYTQQEKERYTAGKERWVPAEFDGTILTFHYGASNFTYDYDDWRELNYTIEFPPYGTPKGHFVQRYTDSGYTGFPGKRVQKLGVTWKRASEAEVNAWRKIPE